MKKLILSLLVLTLALGSCNMANDDDYKNLAKDLCDCVNKNSKDISPKMREAIIMSAENGKDFEKVLTEAITEDPAGGMKDYNAVMALMKSMGTCVKDLEKKYKDIYTADTEDEMQKKLMDVFKAEKNCDLTYAIMKKGLEQNGK